LASLERSGRLIFPASSPSKGVKVTVSSRETAPSPANVPQAVVLDCSLADLGELNLLKVAGATTNDGRAWIEMMGRHHYLGAGPIMGCQIRYLITSSRGVLGGLSFSAPAWRLACRDEMIGWDDRQRKQNLSLVACNSRFLILPTVRVPNLASSVLALAQRQLAKDWETHHGVRLALLETFVDISRFQGTCYRAANWLEAGISSGRGRNDDRGPEDLQPKRVFLMPLTPDWQTRLRHEEKSPVKIRPGTVSAPSSTEGDNWANEELGNADYGDPRLTRRLLSIVQAMSARPATPLTEVFGGRAADLRGAYRFFDNPHTTMEATLQPHYENTLRRAQTEAVVLAVQDTTSLNYSTHTSTIGLGPIGARSVANPPVGLHVHDTMAFTEKGVPLGLMHVKCWARGEEATAPRGKARQLDPIEEKESIKWLDSFRQVQAFRAHLPKETRVVSVGDREADIYELIHESLESLKGESPVDLLVRAVKNRKLVKEDDMLAEEDNNLAKEDDKLTEHDDKLWATVEASAILCERELHIPRRKGQKARTTKISIRATQVRIKAPSWKKNLPKELSIWALLAREEAPPADQEPIEWMLLSTVPMNSPAEAARVLDWYIIRWQIEVYHRILKSGCKIEDRLFGTAERIESCLAVDMIMGWRVMRLTKLGRENPSLPCTVYFEEAQWRALCMRVYRDPKPWTAPPPHWVRPWSWSRNLAAILAEKTTGHPAQKPSGEACNIWMIPPIRGSS